MSHLFSAAMRRVSTSNSDGGGGGGPEDHQPGVSPPLSPISTRDHERQVSPVEDIQPMTAIAPSKVKARTLPDEDEIIAHPLDPSTTAAPGPSTDFPALSTAPSRISNAMGPVTPAYEEADPLLLRSRLVAESDLRRRPTNQGRRATKDVKDFYETQNSHIENLLKPLHVHGQQVDEDREGNQWRIRVAIYGSFAANCILAILQLYAAISSLSLSIFATAADSVFDPFANIALLWLHRKASRVDERSWPAGGSRFENVGNCVYAFLMGAVSVILVVESIRALATHGDGEDTNRLNIPSLVAVAIAFGVKFALFLYCFALRRFSSQIGVLAVDHRNDLFINGLGIMTSALGSKIAWWIDPAGAMFISICIIVVWSLTAAENFKQLAGKGAPPDFLQLITYNVMLYHEQIVAVDSVKAYHSGPEYCVEVDIVMHRDTPLHEAHDVAQSLQDKLEGLPHVDRSFVHVDYETSHAPEHRKKV